MFNRRLSIKSYVFISIVTTLLVIQYALATPVDRGGISLGKTRVIYNEKDSGASLRVINTSSSPFLIQSWVDNFRGEGGWENPTNLSKSLFIVTPPLFRLDKGENSVLIRRTGGKLPTDRESVFSVSVKSIPQTERPAENASYIQFAFVSNIKMFWRPQGLSGSPTEAYKQLTFRRLGDRIEAVNSSEYHITLQTLKVGNIVITDPDKRMVPPKGTQTWTLPAGTNGSVTYTAITDFGGLTQPQTSPLL